MATRKLPYKTALAYTPHSGEINNSPSQTVQGETRTIKEIIDRYRKTGQIEQRVPVYFDAEDITLINHFFQPGQLDLTDIDDLNAKVQHLTESIERAKQNEAEAQKNEEPEATEPENTEEE